VPTSSPIPQALSISAPQSKAGAPAVPVLVSSSVVPEVEVGPLVGTTPDVSLPPLLVSGPDVSLPLPVDALDVDGPPSVVLLDPPPPPHAATRPKTKPRAYPVVLVIMRPTLAQSRGRRRTRSRQR
jgi:hypothetical protein